jgi:hypothetical protein
MSEKSRPLADNPRCRMLLRLLHEGPQSTIDLQARLPLLHVARQVWELRHWYGFRIKTGRLPNYVAVYTLLDSPAATPAGPPNVTRKTEAVAVAGLFDR